jgi:hypothetical protein
MPSLKTTFTGMTAAFCALPVGDVESTVGGVVSGVELLLPPLQPKRTDTANKLTNIKLHNAFFILFLLCFYGSNTASLNRQKNREFTPS